MACAAPAPSCRWRAVRSCLMLAVQAEGSKVVTVEGLSNDGELTPLQKSFRKHHALQCGFCTPGMHHHRACALERGAGLRCRPRARGAVRQICAAAPAISPSSKRCSTRAPPTGRTRRGTLQQPEPRHEDVNTLIGSPIERLEDLRFLRGRGEYVDDLAREGLAACCHPAQLRGARPHPLDRCLAGARACPACTAVITAKDIGQPVPPIVPMRLQPLPQFKPFEPAGDRGRQGALCRRADRRGAGGQRRARARTRLGVIDVEIEPLPAVADRVASARKAALLFEEKGTNLAMTFRAVRGDAAAAFANAPYTRRESFRTQRHYGAPHGAARRAGGMGCGAREAHGFRRRQGAVLQPPHPRQAASGLPKVRSSWSRTTSAAASARAASSIRRIFSSRSRPAMSAGR